MQTHDRPPLAVRVILYVFVIALGISTIFLFSALCLYLISSEITRFEQFLPDDPSEKFKLLVTLFGIVSAALTSVVGVVVAIVTYRNSVRNAERSRKKQHTINILFETRLSEQFQMTNRQRRLVFPEYQDVTFALWDKARKRRAVDYYGDPNAEDKARQQREGAEALQMMLNYYEFLAVGLRQDDLDEDMLKNTVRGIMCNLVDDSRLLIHHLRKDNEKTFENLVWLYDRWRGDGAVDVNGSPTERPIPSKN